MPALTDTRTPILGAPRTQWAQVTSLLHLGPGGLGVLRRIREIASLPAGWDGHGSPTLRDAAKTVAASLVAIIALDLLPAPHVSPIAGGGLQFEWRVGPRDLEIEVLPDGSIEYLAVLGGTEMDEGVLSQPSQLDAFFRWLMQC